MKKTIVLLFVLSLVAVSQVVSTAASYSAPFQNKEFRKTVDLQSGAEFRLETDKGSVRLTSWDKNSVEIYARIEPPDNESEDYQRRAVEGARIDVSGGGNSLTVRSNFEDVPYKDSVLDKMSRSKNIPHIHYEIQAPRNLNIVVKIDRSKLDVQGFNGKVNLEADRTPVTARDIEGEFRLEIDRGKADLSNLRGGLDINADRTDGNIEGATISSDSKIDIDRGEIDLHLTGNQGLNVKTDFSKRTHFNSDFSIASRSPREGNFEGTINGGGPRLLIRSDRGTINLKRQ